MASQAEKGEAFRALYQRVAHSSVPIRGTSAPRDRGTPRLRVIQQRAGNSFSAATTHHRMITLISISSIAASIAAERQLCTAHFRGASGKRAMSCTSTIPPSRSKPLVPTAVHAG